MIHAQMSYFDAAVVSIIVISCLLAFFRGFVKEILSLGAWIGAGLITLYYFRDVADWLKPNFKNEMVAGGLATLGLYICCLLAFSLINAVILRFVKEGSDVGFLDNTLGLLFGFARGAFVVSLGFFLMTMVMNEREYPEWIAKAATRPYVEEGAMLLARAAPDYLVEHTALKNKIERRDQERDYVKERGAEGEQASDSSKMDRLMYHIEQSPAR